MSQHIDKLRETLRELETELDQVESLDPQTRELLISAAAEIHEALEKGSPASNSTEEQSFTDRLLKATQSFEDSHPTLSRIVGNLVNALAQLGI